MKKTNVTIHLGGCFVKHKTSPLINKIPSWRGEKKNLILPNMFLWGKALRWVSWQVPIFLLSVGRNGCLLRCSCSTSKFPEQLSIKLVGSEATSRGYQQNLITVSLKCWTATWRSRGYYCILKIYIRNWESWNPTLGPCTCQKLQPHNGYTLRTMGFNAISLHAPTLKATTNWRSVELVDHNAFLCRWPRDFLRCLTFENFEMSKLTIAYTYTLCMFFTRL